MSPEELIHNYYDSLNKKSNAWQEFWSENAIFSDASNTLTAKGKNEIIKSFTTFLKSVESIKVKQVIGEGEDICAIVSYAYRNQKGQRMNQDDAEIWRLHDGKLEKLTIYFDLTAFRSFMRG